MKKEEEENKTNPDEKMQRNSTTMEIFLEK